MAITLYNTATRSKEPFVPQDGRTAKIYCCGPTVYHYAHIGNLRTYIFEDLLRRSLAYHGFDAKHVVNITDVGHLTSDADEGEDKMEKGAKRTGKSVWEVAAFYTDAFMRDFHSLNLLEPTVWCRATDHIAEQIALVKTLEEKGYTYRTSDGIYYDSSKFERYGDFARLDLENLWAGSRISMGEKRLPTDFALWKFSPKDVKRQMEWDSPWGVGFPGWHIECSAMAMKHLGETLDIHCGGTDHVRVHHTNEIAQSEAATGKTFSRFWMHGEFLRLDGDKMSKSTGEFLTVDSLVKRGFSPMDYRYFALGSHYRNYLSFSFESL
ncbi:MAG: cysteine--tRNA ligase, partial [Fibrobacterales bacterium]|nr:cysteine--tRNA ligase [Fibrobacterales bacterium]